MATHAGGGFVGIVIPHRVQDDFVAEHHVVQAPVRVLGLQCGFVEQHLERVDEGYEHRVVCRSSERHMELYVDTGGGLRLLHTDQALPLLVEFGERGDVVGLGADCGQARREHFELHPCLHQIVGCHVVERPVQIDGAGQGQAARVRAEDPAGGSGLDRDHAVTFQDAERFPDHRPADAEVLDEIELGPDAFDRSVAALEDHLGDALHHYVGRALTRDPQSARRKLHGPQVTPRVQFSTLIYYTHNTETGVHVKSGVVIRAMVQSMRFFDAHCDTISKLHAGEGDFDAAQGAGLHVTLPLLQRGGVRAQVFAVWAWKGAYGEETQSAALAMVADLHSLCAAYPEQLSPIRSAADLRAAGEHSTRIAVIAALEGADALQGEAAGLGRFFEAGIRVLTLAWGDNEFCGTVFGGGGGLSERGIELVEMCERVGVAVDVSHASDAAFADVCTVAAKPFIASHSGCRSVCPNDRNLDDHMIRALAERGGVMGINLGSSFLSSEFHTQARTIRERFFEQLGSGGAAFADAQGTSAEAQSLLARPPLGLVAAHVRRAIDVGGEDSVGLGGDLDGVKSLPAGLDSVADYPRIAEMLAEAGLTSRQVEKVCFDNFARVFGDLLP